MKTGPPIAVGETERGGDWGVRVSNPVTSHQKGAAGEAPGVRYREGVCEETDDDESEDESLTATGSNLPETSSLAQRLLWLKQRRVRVLQSSRHHKLNASDSPPNRKINHFNHKLAASDSSPNSQGNHASPKSSSIFNMASTTSKGASVRVQSPAKSKRSSKVSSLKRFPKTSSSKKSQSNAFVSLSKSNSSNSSSSNSSSSNSRFRRSPTSPSSEENDSLVSNRLRGQPSTSRSSESDPFLPSPPPSPPGSPSRDSPPHSPRWLFGGSRPISTLARPLVALAVPGMFLVCKYHQYKRAHQEACRRRAAERELHHLNHKIVKLLDKLDEHETEMARSREEECVICVNAKATMQTFPCGHRVVCRKCFVKTIQVAVSQRLLPLRCVVCRAKILRLRQSTTGIPSSVSQYCLGDRRLDRRRDRLAGLPASQSLHSFSSAASAVSGLSIAGCSSDNEGGRARTPRPTLSCRPLDATRPCDTASGRASIKTKRIPSSLAPLAHPLPSPPSGPCLHFSPRGLSSPRGFVSPQGALSPRGYEDGPRGLPRMSLHRAGHDFRGSTFRRRSYIVSDHQPLGARGVRVHIRENKIAPQEGVARLPTITECSELCSERQADRRSVIRLRSAQRLLSQLELPPSHCPPSPPSSSPTASFLSLSSPSSSSSLSLSSSSLSSFKSSLASPLPPNSGTSSPRIPSLTPHTPPSSPTSPIEGEYSPRCYFRLRTGGCSYTSDDSDSSDDSRDEESDGDGCCGAQRLRSSEISKAKSESKELSWNDTRRQIQMRNGAGTKTVFDDGTEEDFLSPGLTSNKRNDSQHVPNREENRLLEKAPELRVCDVENFKCDIYQKTAVSVSVTLDGNRNVKTYNSEPGRAVRCENGSKTAVFSRFSVETSRSSNPIRNEKFSNVSSDSRNTHGIPDKSSNKAVSGSGNIRDKGEGEIPIKQSDSERKVETTRAGDAAKSGLKKATNVNRKGTTNTSASDAKLPSKFSYRDNPKYFFYSYTGDSATEVPLASLASSKSSSNLKNSAKGSSTGRSLTKSVSSKSLSTKAKSSSKTRLPKSSSSSSRLAKRSGDETIMRPSSSNKSISSAASTSSSCSIRSSSSRCSTNSSVSYKSAVSSQSSSNVTKTKLSRSFASSHNEPKVTKSISFSRSASQACPITSSSEMTPTSTSIKIAKSFSSAKDQLPDPSGVPGDRNSSSQKAQTMPKPSISKKSNANSYTNSLSKLESFFCKSPPVNYNSLECNSPNSKHDTLSSCKSSREGSLSRELDLSSCSSSSASTATVRSYRSLLPAGLRVNHDTTAIRNKENRDVSGCNHANQNQKVMQKEFRKSSGSESSPSPKESGVRKEKPSCREKNLDKSISVGKEIIERAFKGGKGKSSRLGRSIKGVRWKEGEKEDNNNTPAKKPKPATENRKSEGGILRSKVFSGRHYYRFK